MQRKQRHAADDQLLHGHAAEEHLLCGLPADVELFDPEVGQLRHLRDAMLLHVRRVVDRPCDDDLLAGEDAALVGVGDDENRIASRGHELVKDADGIVAAGGEVGQNLNRERRECLDLSVRAMQRQRPDQRRAGVDRMRDVAQHFSPRGLAVDPRKLR